MPGSDHPLLSRLVRHEHCISHSAHPASFGRGGGGMHAKGFRRPSRQAWRAHDDDVTELTANAICRRLGGP